MMMRLVLLVALLSGSALQAPPTVASRQSRLLVNGLAMMAVGVGLNAYGFSTRVGVHLAQVYLFDE